MNSHENENCLKDLKCSKCGSLGPFTIRCLAWCAVNDDGTDEAYNHSWGDESPCVCIGCSLSGKIKDFKIKKKKTGWFCHDPRHETPCPLPCVACNAECGRQHFWGPAKQGDLAHGLTIRGERHA